MCHTIGDNLIRLCERFKYPLGRGGAFPASMAHRDEVSIRTKLESTKRLVEEAEAEVVEKVAVSLSAGSNS